jgi:hypothetical protein
MTAGPNVEAVYGVHAAALDGHSNRSNGILNARQIPGRLMPSAQPVSRSAEASIHPTTATPNASGIQSFFVSIMSQQPRSIMLAAFGAISADFDGLPVAEDGLSKSGVSGVVPDCVEAATVGLELAHFVIGILVKAARHDPPVPCDHGTSPHPAAFVFHRVAQ